MSLDSSDVKKIAHLARLAIDEADIAHYATNLSDILHLVEQMDSVNTDTVIPMAHPLDEVQRLREDAVTESDQREHFQQCAPLTEDGLYLVPKVIE
jgi:aspartyl-tRNA(Asn)/glutamyl-tRNA(Gln) amidotransferase subunit C